MHNKASYMDLISIHNVLRMHINIYNTRYDAQINVQKKKIRIFIVSRYIALYYANA